MGTYYEIYKELVEMGVIDSKHDFDFVFEENSPKAPKTHTRYNTPEIEISHRSADIAKLEYNSTGNSRRE